MRELERPKVHIPKMPAANVRISAPGIWKRPKCAKCGKKIRNIKKLKYVDGKPYHIACLEEADA